MANTIPSQVRAIDPYSEFNSNSINVLTRMVSRGSNCILSNYRVDVIEDSTSPLTYAVITPGICIKDDILIRILSNFRVDFADLDFYISAPPFNEAGYYYIVLDYTYSKVKPAPQASIKILKPSQRGLLSGSYLLLKIVEVIYTGSEFNISTFIDYDPSIITNKINCSQTFSSLEAFLPSFDPSNDVGRIVYDEQIGIPYIGDFEGWKEFGTLDYQCDTSGCSVGQLVYIGGGNVAIPAISSDLSTCATAFVIIVGTIGRVRVTGFVRGGIAQTGITISEGDTLYLSSTEVGTVTNVIPLSGITQVIGTCIYTSGSDYSTIITSMSGVEGDIYHNSLLGLQGGSLTERYHLNQSQYNNIGTGDHEGLAGLLGGDGTFHYHVGHSTFHNLGDGTHNQIAGTQGGSLAEQYHFTLAEHTALSAFGGNHNNIPSGLQGGSSTERYHLSQTNYTALTSFGGNHNNCPTGLQGGNSTERYHLTQDQYNKVVTFPSGTVMFFAQASAPSGWTQITSYNDRVIRVVSGVGGGSGGSWTISGLTGASHTHSTGDFVLQVINIPPHYHMAPTSNGLGGPYEVPPPGVFSGYDYGAQSAPTQSAGGGAAHNHGTTGTPSSTTVSSSGAWRPSYLDVIIAQKD